MSELPVPLRPAEDERGLATSDPEGVVRATLSAWESFLDATSRLSLSAVPAANLEQMVALGTFSGQPGLAVLLDEAREAAGTPSPDASAGGNQPAAKRSSTGARARASQATGEEEAAEAAAGDRDLLLTALQRSRDQFASWVGSADSDWQQIARSPVETTMGRLPLLTALHGAAYQQVLALLDVPGVQAEPSLLATAVSALVDTTGAFAARSGTQASIVAVSSEACVGTGATRGAWRTCAVGTEEASNYGPRVYADAAVLVAITSGRADVPTLYRTGQLRVADLPGLMQWLPVLQDVPGLSSAGSLQRAAKYLGAASSLLSRLDPRRRK